MTKYYSLDHLDYNYPDARYHLIFGERSNGKTSAVLERILYNWVYKGEKGAYIRRLDADIVPKMAHRVWKSITDERGLVEEYTNGEWTTIVFKSGDWYLAKFDEELNRNVLQQESFCYALAITTAEKYKGTSYPEVTTILFDEFLTRSRYLRDEFVEYQNLLSTIIRQRDNVKVYMLGNTVNKYSPYFDEMGLDDVDEMQPGHIKHYTLKSKNRKLEIVAQYCLPNEEGKASDVYFAPFGNKKLDMITSGDWEIPMYPRAPMKYKPSEIIDDFFIEFRDRVLHGEIVGSEDTLFVYIHKKTTPIKDDGFTMIYSLEPSPKINRAITLDGPMFRNKISELIGRIFKEGQVYYQDNHIGELVRNYQNLAKNIRQGP